MIKIIRDTSVEKFLEKTADLLYRDEPTNSLMLGLCEGMLAAIPKNPPVLIRIDNNDETVSAAIQTPPMNLVLTFADHDALIKLAQYLKSSDVTFPGVIGPAAESEFFAKEWSAVSGKTNKLGMGQKIYQLEKVILPRGIEGNLHVATAQDSKIVYEWITAFVQESLPASDHVGEGHWRDFTQKAIQKQTAHLWMKNGQPVSMAFASRPTKHGVSISGVYTPHKFRKKGFGSAVVAFLSQKMLDAGKNFCVLYTDLANATSNKIYQDIGYQEVSDSKHFIFE